MAKKSWKNPNDKIEVKPQKFKWKTKKIVSSYKEANIYKSSLNEEHIKIKRCGPDGINFAIKVGSRIKKNENVSIGTSNDG